MFYKTPIWYLSFVSLVGFSLFFLAIYLTQIQPSLGLSLSVDNQGNVQLSAPGTGPTEGLEQGWQLQRISGDGGDHIITAQTLIEEPDTLGTKANMRVFFQDQNDLVKTLQGDRATLSGQNPEGPWRRDVEIQSARSLWNVPSSFWIQLVSGLSATLVGGWVWSLRPKGAEQIGLLLSGVGLQLSASMAAIYSSRELALPDPMFATLSSLNLLGTLSFGAGLVMVFASYPKPFLRGWMVYVPPFVVWGYQLVVFLADVQSLDVSLYMPIVALLLVIIGLIIAQFFAARKDPMARAALRVLALGFVVGAGAFVMTRAVPIILGFGAVVSQSMLFPLIALFFVSVALSVVRYRLFDMPRWSALILFYFLGACLILTVDSILVFGLALGRQPALAASLLFVGFAYLPLRDRLMRYVTRRARRDQDQETSLLAMADFIARADTPQQMQSRWQDSLESLFEPLHMAELNEADPPLKPSLIDFGRTLALPAVKQGMTPLRLVLPKRGQRLFMAEDRNKAAELMSLVAELQRGHAAYDSGVETERSRIARDLHDNISIHLLGALHSEDTERKNAFVRETLANLRQIISADTDAQTDLGLLLNELRFRIAETLTAKGITLDWPVRDLRGIEADAETAQTIKAITNEAVTNVIRHANARNVSIGVKATQDDLTLTISDDGIGLGAEDRKGNGLHNMRERVTQIGGTAHANSGVQGQGLTWEFTLPRGASKHNKKALSA